MPSTEKSEVISELETVREKEKATKAKMTRIKQIQEQEKNGERPNSASTVSSVEDMVRQMSSCTLPFACVRVRVLVPHGCSVA